MVDKFITDFSHPIFQAGFKQYFAELAIAVSDFNALFEQMNADEGTAAFIRYDDTDECIGFIQITPITFSSWFFEERYGFIRELWVNKKFRHCGHASALMRLAEDFFRENDIHKSILTTNTAPEFYEKLGYEFAPDCKAKNNDDVYIKKLRPPL